MDKFIKDIRQKLGLTQEEFAKKIGVSVVTVSKYENGVTKPTKQKLGLIENLVNQSNNNINNVETNGAERNASAAVYANDAIPLAQAEFKPIIPSELYNKLDCDINDYIHENLNNVRRSETIRQFAPFSYFFEIMGDAMLPDFRPADMLALKILPQPWKIESGRVYVIDTKGGILVRMLYRIDAENFIARALNPRFTELPIPSSDVYDIYMVVGLVRRNI